MRVLVTGGAGYIGSHTVALLRAAGEPVWVYDNLSRGHVEAVPEEILIRGDLADGDRLKQVLAEKRIDAVIHFAALSQVGESVEDPARYYSNNVVGTLSLLEAMRAADVGRIVFSSTCAIYGEPGRVPIAEDIPKEPVNPYGFTKLAIEKALEHYAAAYGFGYAALRYFNACGADREGRLGEDHDPETHAIPLALEVASGKRECFRIFGEDYPTEDGTCVRDYVHVEDLGDAHLRALERIEAGQGLCLNLGTGRGFSVREVIESCRRVSGREIRVKSAPRRPGDPPVLVAAGDRARSALDWTPRYTDLDAMVETAWRWHSSHPNGYGSADS